MVGAVVHLMDRAGARRIRLLECGYASAIPLDEYMYQAGWNVEEIVRAGTRVELENTNWLGRAKEYHRFDVPGGGLLFPSYHLNPSYRDCDVFVSLTKLKDHTTAGVTLSMKNCFGNIPTTIYGDNVPKDAPDELPHSGRDVVFHEGARQPASLAAPEKDPSRHDTRATASRGWSSTSARRGPSTSRSSTGSSRWAAPRGPGAGARAATPGCSSRARTA